METQDKKIQEAEEKTNEDKKSTSEQASTATDVNKEAGSHFEHVKETLEQLYNEFPKAFIKEGDAKPLKIGIFDDLKTAIADKPEFSISKVRAALRLYTTRLRYLYCIKEGAKRVDLQGNEVEEVSAEHVEFAKNKFDEIKDKRKTSKQIQDKKSGDKKQSKKKSFGKKNNKPAERKVNGIKPELSDLTVGREILVLTGEHHYVMGSVAENAQGDKVSVTLRTGMTVSMPLDRVLLPVSKK